MKSTMKKLSMMIVVVLVLSLLSITVYADNNTLTITSETSGHTYQIYQVFDGDYSNSGSNPVLSNVVWGTGVNGIALRAALATAYPTIFNTSMTAAQVADAMATMASSETNNLATIISQHLATATTPVTSTVTGAGPYNYVFTGLNDGYYFVNEADLAAGVDNAATKFMLQILGNVTVAAKTDKPAIAKKVLENNDATYQDTWNDAADYSIGDDVSFRIVGLIPSMDYYSTYAYTMTDTLSDGLAFNSASVKVYLANGASMYAVETATATGAGGTEILPASGYAVASTATGFTVTFANLKAVSGVTGYEYVVVEYTAELDSDAVIGNNGNPNEVFLTYSNNPNDSADFGVTPKDEVVVFTFELPVAKVDDATPANALLGATFALFTNSADADAAVADPTALTNALYFSGSAGNYTLSDAGSQVLESTNPAATYSLKGLDQGTYYLVEIDEPTGYNRLGAAITVVVAPAYTAVNYVDGHVPDATADQLTGVTVNGGSVVTVVNETGSILPETGGIGTTIFTLVGIILMAGAAVIFITKRKVSAHKE